MSTCTSERPVAGGAVRLSPSAPGRRRAGLLFLALLLCGTLAGCYASRDAQTAQETPDTAGVDGGVGTMVLDDVYLDTAVTVPAGGSVALRASFTDKSAQPDRLIAVTTPVAASVELLQPDGTVATGGIEVPGQGQLDAATGPVLVRLDGLTRALSPQALVPITFTFEKAGRVTLDDVPAATPAQGQAQTHG
jgi:copper(I)-binding protein